MADRLARDLATRGIVMSADWRVAVMRLPIRVLSPPMAELGTLRWAQYNDADHHAIAMKTILLPESRNSA